MKRKTVLISDDGHCVTVVQPNNLESGSCVVKQTRAGCEHVVFLSATELDRLFAATDDQPVPATLRGRTEI